MYAIDERFFEEVGFSKDAVMTWGFRSYDDELGIWYVSVYDAREFLTALDADPALAEI